MAQCPPAPAAIVNRAEVGYPDAARADHLEGTALVKVQLDATGKVLKTTVQKSAGAGVLDQAAQKAAEKSTYKAASLDCKSVEGIYIMVIDFKP